MTHRAWIVDAVGAPTFDRLAEGLSGSELQSLLLEVMQARAEARGAKELVAQYGRDPFCTPASVDQRSMLAIDQHLLAAAERFEAVELSPVAPMGCCSVVGPTHQHRVLSALRATEVVSDPTNVLALECAQRLRANPTTDLHLATSHRRQRLGDQLAELLEAERKPLEHPYYSGGLRYRIWVATPGGEELPLADGGTFDWLGQFTSNRRAVFVGSGLGSQLIAWRLGCGPST